MGDPMMWVQHLIGQVDAQMLLRYSHAQFDLMADLLPLL
jgi:hypothetical protein